MTAGAGAPAWARVRRFGPLALVAALVVLAFASGLADHLSLGELRARRLELEALVRVHPWLSLAAYASLYIAVVALSIPAALVLTLTGGLLFGPWLGGAAAAASCTLGAGIIFLVCRSAAGDLLQRRAAAAARIEAGVRRDAFSYVLILRLAPVMPFWLANLALGLVDIPFSTFLTASFLGITPVSLVYAGVGASLNTVFAKGARPDLHVLFRPEVFLPLIGLVVLSLVPIIARRLRKMGRR
ncbi:MAG: TVP38/TMEM64 family protein [Caulobacteraceae bacterium]|nr:TVP38/TMEM64 family protein [Caulobacteraceae bacterium]